jgi:D-glycero-beta-D-manno-heptose 1-phosphate adenylyltransferase
VNAPILDEDSAVEAARRARTAGQSIAFANGVFDLLHVGHVRYIQDAARVADLLVVAVNSDSSVRMIKGEGRPLVPEEERAELVAALRGVGLVTIFSESSPRTLLTRIRPDFHCKGTDYTAESVPERELVESWGGRVVIVGDPKDHSSTELIDRLPTRQPGS